jgi:hypothetical protein
MDGWRSRSSSACYLARGHLDSFTQWPISGCHEQENHKRGNERAPTIRASCMKQYSSLLSHGDLLSTVCEGVASVAAKRLMQADSRGLEAEGITTTCVTSPAQLTDNIYFMDCFDHLFQIFPTQGLHGPAPCTSPRTFASLQFD